MSRLLHRTVEEVQEDRVTSARDAASQTGQVVVLKGAYTVVAAPDGRTCLSPFANPALASGGTGDVLAGIIGGLLAQGCERYEAAVIGVYIHAMAGEAVVDDIGNAGLLASDLLLEIPRAMQALRAG
jgi:NAD(P)H-hydrate epimerase